MSISTVLNIILNFNLFDLKILKQYNFHFSFVSYYTGWNLLNPPTTNLTKHILFKYYTEIYKFSYDTCTCKLERVLLVFNKVINHCTYLHIGKPFFSRSMALVYWTSQCMVPNTLDKGVYMKTQKLVRPIHCWTVLNAKSLPMLRMLVSDKQIIQTKFYFATRA